MWSNNYYSSAVSQCDELTPDPLHGGRIFVGADISEVAFEVTARIFLGARFDQEGREVKQSVSVCRDKVDYPTPSDE